MAEASVERESLGKWGFEMSTRWKQACISPTASIGDAIRSIDQSSLQIALIVEDGHLRGTLTDGDVRRAILRGSSLNDPVISAMNPHPKTAILGESRDVVIAQMQNLSIRQMPIVDSEGLLTGLEILDDILSPCSLENHVILMAGGLGRRLSPLTDNCPKPMLPIGGRPILETALLNFVGYGFRKFLISVNYKSEMIQDYFGDGSRWGVSINYLRETKPLGTAGALSLLDDLPSLPVIIMNGDVLTKVNFQQLLEFHADHHSKATMCVREYEYQVPYGVVKIDGYQIVELQEKPIQRFFVNAGIYVLDPDILHLIVREEWLDMTDLFHQAIKAEQPHAVFPIREYWTDIGRHDDFVNASTQFGSVFQ